MPIYEFKCNSCNGKFEKLVSFSAVGQQQECPHCKSQNTRKLISSFATGSSSTSGSAGSSASSSAGCSSTGRFT